MASDDVSYFIPSIPDEVVKCVQLLRKISTAEFSAVLGFTSKYIQGDDVSERQFHELHRTTKIPKHQLSIIFTGLYLIQRAALRSKVPIKEFKSSLSILQVPEELTSYLIESYSALLSNVDDLLPHKNAQCPQLERLKWRVDVTVSTSALSRAMIPTILMKASMSDGEEHVFETSLEKFQQLR